jgi:hypothetical protein
VEDENKKAEQQWSEQRGSREVVARTVIGIM